MKTKMNSKLTGVMTDGSDHRAALAKRLGYAALTLFFVAFLVTEMVWSPNSAHNRAEIWAPLVFLILPDVSLLFGMGSGLERGQIHPRAVRLYNLVHRFWIGPAIAIVAGFLFPTSPWFLVGLAWGAHIAFDRALGLGLRDPSGFARRV